MNRVDVTQDDEGIEGKELPDLPVSPPLLSLFVRYHRAKTVRERHEVCLQIAQQFAIEYDPTAQDATEEWHSFFEQYERAEQAMDHAAIKLSRLAIHWISEEMSKSDMTLDDVVQGVEQAARSAN